MTRYACQDCGKDLPRGTAVLRSRSFRIVAWCDRCYGVAHLGHTPPAEVIGGTLLERLARALTAQRGGAAQTAPPRILQHRG